jgi:hypothetical protein
VRPVLFWVLILHNCLETVWNLRLFFFYFNHFKKGFTHKGSNQGTFVFQLFSAHSSAEPYSPVYFKFEHVFRITRIVCGLNPFIAIVHLYKSLHLQIPQKNYAAIITYIHAHREQVCYRQTWHFTYFMPGASREGLQGFGMENVSNLLARVVLAPPIHSATLR